VTPKKLTIALPPKPSRTNKSTKLQKDAAPTYGDPQYVKAYNIRIDLEDGTYLTATGDQAADIYFYLMDCEKYCATHSETVAPYLGPAFSRLDTTGSIIHPSTVKPT